MAYVWGILFLGIMVFVFCRKKENQSQLSSEKKVISRERARELILGKGPKARHVNGDVDKDELHFVMLKIHYDFGKAFGMAAKTEKNSLVLDNGDEIQPSTREHGISAGETAEELRAQTLKEYGIDLEDLTDYDNVKFN